MRTRLIEASWVRLTRGRAERLVREGAWGRFVVGVFDDADWARTSAEDEAGVLARCGWRRRAVFVLDLETGIGVLRGGEGRADESPPRASPLYGPFCAWVDEFLDEHAFAELPDLVLLRKRDRDGELGRAAAREARCGPGE